jgi:hypothetical protein
MALTGISFKTELLSCHDVILQYDSCGTHAHLSSVAVFLFAQETIFPMPEPHIFSSDHIEDRVPLAMVLGKCNIVTSLTHAAETRSSRQSEQHEACTFVCTLHYDYITMTLSAAQGLS